MRMQVATQAGKNNKYFVFVDKRTRLGVNYGDWSTWTDESIVENVGCIPMCRARKGDRMLTSALTGKHFLERLAELQQVEWDVADIVRV